MDKKSYYVLGDSITTTGWNIIPKRVFISIGTVIVVLSQLCKSIIFKETSNASVCEED